jgi:ribosomal protein S12 methylthiotransferase accessory factor YcaO
VSAAGTAKGHRAGTDRTVSPALTLERIAPLLPAMGITRVADVTGLDCIGIPVAFCCRPNSRALAVSQGKGLDLASAKASAVMESVEAFHAERVSRPVRWATYAELASHGEPVAEARLLGRSRVSPFHEHLQLPWVRGADLVSGLTTWVPYEAVHTDFRVLLLPTSGTFVCSSNGLASGNHPLEALSHALCEAIERDATSLWQIRGGEGSDERRLDLASVDDRRARRCSSATTPPASRSRYGRRPATSASPRSPAASASAPRTRRGCSTTRAAWAATRGARSRCCER